MVQKAVKRDDFPLEYVDMRDIDDGHVTGMMSALQFQHRLFVREMGGLLLPAQIPLDGVETVLDLICGPGSWCMDFSKLYPEKRVYGVDINADIVAMAQENAAHARSDQITFLLADRHPPWPFPDATFDLIHLQNGASLFTLTQWPTVMMELYRLLKPGGWLNLVDFEMGPASQPALDRVLTLLAQILAKLDRNISPNGMAPFTGCTLGASRMAQQFFTEIAYQLYPVDLGGWNNPVGRAYLAWSVVRPEMIVYLAKKTGISTDEELRPLLREMQRELQQFSFCGVGMLLSTFGRKPLAKAKRN